MGTHSAKGWPDLSALDLAPTLDALHLWSQIVGKIRLMMTPWENHSWHVALYLSARGFGTGPIPAGTRALAMEFDLLAGVLDIRDTDGGAALVRLTRRSVASFYAETMAALGGLGFGATIDPMPCEIPNAIPFPKDERVRAYDAAAARMYWRALVQIHRVFQRFRTRFEGKCSPIHLFWGSFDLAVTRFSGRAAPRHPGGIPHMPDAVGREAYCQEVSSAGFWPGAGAAYGPCFYSYAYPAPQGFENAPVAPAAARFDSGLGEFLLPYAAIFAGGDPDSALLEFLQSSYEAAANLARWDRKKLERAEGPVGRPPPGY